MKLLWSFQGLVVTFKWFDTVVVLEIFCTNVVDLALCVFNKLKLNWKCLWDISGASGDSGNFQEIYSLTSYLLTCLKMYRIQGALIENGEKQNNLTIS